MILSVLGVPNESTTQTAQSKSVAKSDLDSFKLFQCGTESAGEGLPGRKHFRLHNLFLSSHRFPVGPIPWNSECLRFLSPIRQGQWLFRRGRIDSSHRLRIILMRPKLVTKRMGKEGPSGRLLCSRSARPEKDLVRRPQLDQHGCHSKGTDTSERGSTILCAQTEKWLADASRNGECPNFGSLTLPWSGFPGNGIHCPAHSI